MTADRLPVASSHREGSTSGDCQHNRGHGAVALHLADEPLKVSTRHRPPRSDRPTGQGECPAQRRARLAVDKGDREHAREARRASGFRKGPTAPGRRRRKLTDPMLDIHPLAGGADRCQDVVGSRLIEEPARLSRERHSGPGVHRHAVTCRPLACRRAIWRPRRGLSALATSAGRTRAAPGLPPNRRTSRSTQRELRRHEVDGTVQVPVGPYDRHHGAGAASAAPAARAGSP